METRLKNLEIVSRISHKKINTKICNPPTKELSLKQTQAKYFSNRVFHLNLNND